MVTMLCLLAVAAGVGAWIVHAVREAHGRVFVETAKMNVFEFQPSEKMSRFADIQQILVSIEGAKTAMRAMGKYVPLDLVKRLYRERREPILGAESIEVSIMFTDIKDFTAYSEALEPARLADALGRYLDVMAGVIQGEAQGTIDKYIGDAIMALWNAPEPTDHHPEKACLAALRCREAGRTLFASAEWTGLPPFLTRIGLHCGEALVGHFGAHNRMNYTAVGDAVNLASRLESLNKLYGTEILTSESIRIGAQGRYRFRLVDIVAVKGKTAATKIYELLGPKDDGVEASKCALDYEQAFDAYLRRDFAAALALLRSHAADGPSRVLAERCRGYSSAPPPADWPGVFTLDFK
jgi:adenylate cyclase